MRALLRIFKSKVGMKAGGKPMRIARVSTLLFVAMVFFGASALRAEDVPQEYRDCVRKGLEWLVQQQFRDGHW